MVIDDDRSGQRVNRDFHPVPGLSFEERSYDPWKFFSTDPTGFKSTNSRRATSLGYNVSG